MDPASIIGLVAAVGQLAGYGIAFTETLRQPRSQKQELDRVRQCIKLLSQLRDAIGEGDAYVEDVKGLVKRCQTLIQDHDPDLRRNLGSFTFKRPASLKDEFPKIQIDLLQLVTVFKVIHPPSTPSSSVSQQQDTASGTPPILPDCTLPEPAITSSISRRGSLDFIDLPTTIRLEEDDPVGIALQRVNILERDDESRTLQWESEDRQVIVTHRIPFGTIPTTNDEIHATRVSFLSNHEITVEDRNGKRPYSLDPTYHFRSHTNCKDFLCKVRERDLIETFLPDAIHRGNKLVARGKVLRIWRKSGGPNRPGPLVTISFLQRDTRNPEDGRQVEWDLSHCDRDAEARDKTVYIWGDNGSTNLSLGFKSSKPAKKFAAVYKDVYPERSPASPAHLPSTPSLPAKTPSLPAKTSSLPAKTPSLPAKTPSPLADKTPALPPFSFENPG